MRKLRVVPLQVVCFLVMLLSFMAVEPLLSLSCAFLLVPFAIFCTLLSYARLPSDWGQPRLPESRDVRRRTASTIAGCLALIATTVLFAWPLRLSVALSTPFLRSLVQEAKAHGEIKTPRQALFFRVQKTTLSNGKARLWLHLPSYEEGDCSYTLLAEGPLKGQDFSQQNLLSFNNQWTLVHEMD